MKTGSILVLTLLSALVPGSRLGKHTRSPAPVVYTRPFANGFLDSPITLDEDELDDGRDAVIANEDGLNVDATTSTDRLDSLSSPAGVPAGSAANDMQNIRNCQRQLKIHHGGDEEEQERPGEQPLSRESIICPRTPAISWRGFLLAAVQVKNHRRPLGRSMTSLSNTRERSA